MRLTALSLFVCLLPAFAGTTLSVEVQQNPGSTGDLHGYSLQIQLVQNRTVGDWASASVDGIFNFRNVEPGTYELRLYDSNNRLIRNEVHYITGFNARVTLQLPQQSSSGPRGAVSLARLKHKPPKEARKAVEKAARTRDPRQAIAMLEKAVALDPDFFEAQNNLGVRYYSLARYQDALRHFSNSARIDPGSGQVHTNCAAALLALHRPAEAEVNLRRAVALNDDSPQVSYLLALSRAQQNRLDTETQNLLESVVDRIPRARLVLAQVYERQGNKPLARAQLRSYLETPNPDQRPNVEKWLQHLR